MATLTLQDVPDELHLRLKAEAERSGRSVDQYALTILERALKPAVPVAPARMPTPIVPLRPITEEEISAAIREGRE